MALSPSVWFILRRLCQASAGTWDLINGGPATALPKLFMARPLEPTPSTLMEASSSDGRTPNRRTDRRQMGKRCRRTHPHPERRIQRRGNGGERGWQCNRGRRLQSAQTAPGSGVLPRVSNGSGKDGRKKLYFAGCQRRWQNRGRFYQRRGSSRVRAVFGEKVEALITPCQVPGDSGAIVPDGWDLNAASVISRGR